MRGRLLAVVLTIPLAASGAAGAVLHICQSMGGIVVGDCDCKKQAEAAPSGHEGCEEHAASPAPLRLESQPCCNVELSSAERWAALQEVTSERIADASLTHGERKADDFAASPRTCAPGLSRERGPPNVHGPPIFIRHCSLLN